MSTVFRPARQALFALLQTEFANDPYDVVYGNRFRENATTISLAGGGTIEREEAAFGQRRRDEDFTILIRVLVDRLGAVSADAVDEEWTTILDRIDDVVRDNPTLNGTAGVCWALPGPYRMDDDGAVLRHSRDGWTLHGHLQVDVRARIGG